MELAQCYVSAWMGRGFRGFGGRMKTCICMIESLRCLPGMFITLLIRYTPIQNKKFKV